MRRFTILYLILTDRVLFQQVLVTATHFEDVLALVFLHTHLQLLGRQQHAARLFPDGFCDHLLRDTVVVDLQRVLLLVIVGRHNNPNDHDNLTWIQKLKKK